ncbi:hypothetical protein LTR74_017478 [Friedmanniomyces endolithicus]|nr:hypothetical protein LTR74_017478 [Friedmanniomyces endolithicus]
MRTARYLPAWICKGEELGCATGVGADESQAGAAARNAAVAKELEIDVYHHGTIEVWRRNVRREYNIAARNSHSTIVRAFELQEEPMTIIMEYYPGGNIEDVRHDTTEIAYVSAFSQILCALANLFDCASAIVVQPLAHQI